MLCVFGIGTLPTCPTKSSSCLIQLNLCRRCCRFPARHYFANQTSALPAEKHTASLPRRAPHSPSGPGRQRGNTGSWPRNLRFLRKTNQRGEKSRLYGGGGSRYKLFSAKFPANSEKYRELGLAVVPFRTYPVSGIELNGEIQPFGTNPNRELKGRKQGTPIPCCGNSCGPRRSQPPPTLIKRPSKRG